MIRSWKVKNFKAVQSAMTQLQFGDITIFAGANSSGKSTIIQSLLLLMQSLASRDSSSLVLNGDLVSLGTVDDVWFQGHIEEPMLFEMTLDSPKSGGTVYCELQFVPSSMKPSNTHIRLMDGVYAWDEDGSDDFADLWQTQMVNGAYHIVAASPSFDERWQKQLKGGGFQEVEASMGSRVRLLHFLPTELLGRGKVESHEVKWPVIFSNPLSFDNLTPEDKANSLPDDLRKVLDNAIQYLELPHLRKQSGLNRWLRWDDRDKVTLGEYITWFSKLPAGQVPKLQAYYTKHLVEGLTARLERWYVPQTFDILSTSIYEAFTNRVRYLSANRVAPTALFGLATDNTWSEVGIDGGQVAAAINEFGSKRVMYWHPISKDMQQSTLIEAVVAWLQYFGLIEELRTVDFGKLINSKEIVSNGVKRG